MQFSVKAIFVQIQYIKIFKKNKKMKIRWIPSLKRKQWLSLGLQKKKECKQVVQLHLTSKWNVLNSNLTKFAAAVSFTALPSKFPWLNDENK